MMHQGDTPTTTPASTAIVPLHSNDSAATEAAGGAFEESEEMNFNDLGKNPWSLKETLALLKIRYDLEIFFRDNLFKRALWTEVSRKMAELGYIRNHKKYKQKFQNLYMYYRQSKEKGKTYRFFHLFEAFENLRSISSQPPLRPLQPPVVTNMMISTLPSSSVHPHTQQKIGGTKKLFKKCMKQVIDKQKEFLETFEKREQEKLVKEEAWRTQEMARISREYEIIAQKRSMLAAKDASLLALLQTLSENLPNQPTVQLQQPPEPSRQPPQRLDTTKTDNGDQDMTPASVSASASASSLQWLKVEIEALINLRTTLDSKYPRTGVKARVWKEISAEMGRLGFNRNSKKCKEKWQNIHKYFKIVKEGNKKRPEYPNTCPYFDQLDALYREGNKYKSNNNIASSSSGFVLIEPEQQTTIVATIQPHQDPHPTLDQTFDGEEDTAEEYEDMDEDQENENQEGVEPMLSK